MERPISMPQAEFIKTLCKRKNIDEPDFNNMTSAEASAIIKEHTNQDKEVPVERPGNYQSKETFNKQPWKTVDYSKPKKQDGTSYYTSYAKDIFVALIPVSIAEKDDIHNTMDQAIALVKQAREAFE